jgi:hypothetical protein
MPFIDVCESGNLAYLDYWFGLVNKGVINVHSQHELAFRLACQHGHLQIVKRLLALEGKCRINVHARGEDAFQSACLCGHLPAVKLLLSLKDKRRINVHALGDTAFRFACIGERSDVIRHLLTLDGDRTIPSDVVAACCTKYGGVKALVEAHRRNRFLISLWADGRERARADRTERSGSARLKVLEGLKRASLAEMLGQLGWGISRPFCLDPRHV